ncbi:MAG: hypothetical protein CSA81_14115 [Acidobacteria bacterium]|nr:MAG: hypothetical protein CSA81_14115 [Acidobacteriota bacterium]
MFSSKKTAGQAKADDKFSFEIETMDSGMSGKSGGKEMSVEYNKPPQNLPGADAKLANSPFMKQDAAGAPKSPEAKSPLSQDKKEEPAKSPLDSQPVPEPMTTQNLSAPTGSFETADDAGDLGQSKYSGGIGSEQAFGAAGGGKKVNKVLLIVAALVLLLTVFIGAYYYFFVLKASEKTAAPTTPAQDSVVQEGTAPTDQSGWAMNETGTLPNAEGQSPTGMATEPLGAGSTGSEGVENLAGAPEKLVLTQKLPQALKAYADETDGNLARKDALVAGYFLEFEENGAALPASQILAQLKIDLGRLTPLSKESGRLFVDQQTTVSDAVKFSLVLDYPQGTLDLETTVKELESDLPLKVKPLFVDEAAPFIEDLSTISFRNSTVDKRIRFYPYAASTTGQSIDWGVITVGQKDYLIITTSKDSTKKLVDVLEGSVPVTEKAVGATMKEGMSGTTAGEGAGQATNGNVPGATGTRK